MFTNPSMGGNVVFGGGALKKSEPATNSASLLNLNLDHAEPLSQLLDLDHAEPLFIEKKD